MKCCFGGIAISIKGYCFGLLLFVFCCSVSASIDYEKINQWMVISNDAVADKSLGFYSFSDAQFIHNTELESAQLPINIVMPDGQFAVMSVQWTANGEHWQSLSDNQPVAVTGEQQVSLAALQALPVSTEPVVVIIRVRLVSRGQVHEHRSSAIILSPEHLPEVEVYDVGGTLQGKSRPKLPKNERVAFQPVVDSIRENISQGRLIIYLTSRPRCDSHMLRHWFAQHGLPNWSVLMPNVLPVDENSEIPKHKTLNRLKNKVKIVGAWGNGVNKDIRPYLLARVGVIHHLSWRGSFESSYPKLITELIRHPHYRIARTIAHCQMKTICLNGMSQKYQFQAVESVLRLGRPRIVARPGCTTVTCGPTNPPDDPDDQKPLIVVDDSSSLASMAMQMVAGHGPDIWPAVYHLAQVYLFIQ